jgi:RNA methyltransferase, TrmH family
MSPEEITSLQNSKIKNLLLLQKKSSERKDKELFVVEGIREIKNCIDSGFIITQLYYCEELIPSELFSWASDIISSNRDISISITQNVYGKIAYRESTEGIIAVVKWKQKGLSDLQLSDNPLIIILESVEKPGNLGAILRTADASNADAVIVCDPLTDIYNPNVIRASLGGIFTTQVATCTSLQAIQWLKERKISILTAQLQDSQLYYNTDMKSGVAIVLGTESTGLSQLWREASNAKIRIPMLGKLDSLNVSISAAILCFEAVKQRMQ